MAIAGTLIGSSLNPAFGASLRVAPVLLDLPAPTAASKIRAWNDGDRAINVQVRVFRWKQVGGEDVYEPTRDVVASPPITKIEPRGENLIRIVRTAEHTIMEEESYRLFVDELPDASHRRSGTVTLVVRHSIPVFFGPSELTPANPSWSVARVQGGYEVSVRNSGGQRFRIADLVLSQDGRVLANRDGLLGYVLDGAEMRWTLRARGQEQPSGGMLTISGESEAGHFDAVAPIDGG